MKLKPEYSDEFWFWYDRVHAQVDYFDTAYYVDVNIGQWKKPYKLVERK